MIRRDFAREYNYAVPATLSLLEDLVERGLNAEGDYMFVIDDAKALTKAIKKLFGVNAVIQRCQLHKRRNVSDNLPKEHQIRIDKRLAAAYGMNEIGKARKLSSPYSTNSSRSVKLQQVA